MRRRGLFSGRRKSACSRPRRASCCWLFPGTIAHYTPAIRGLASGGVLPSRFQKRRHCPHPARDDFPPLRHRGRNLPLRSEPSFDEFYPSIFHPRRRGLGALAGGRVAATTQAPGPHCCRWHELRIRVLLFFGKLDLSIPCKTNHRIPQAARTLKALVEWAHIPGIPRPPVSFFISVADFSLPFARAS